MSITLLWIPATILASLLQTARNLTQRGLIEAIGVVGATQVRFVFGFPFALVFLAGVCLAFGRLPPAMTWPTFTLVLWGAYAQIAATGLMLASMRERSFAVTTAYIKTEPVQVAVFGALLLGDHVGLAKFLAIVLATAGVVVVSWRPGTRLAAAGLRPMVLGIAAGGAFALSAIGFRGAILALPDGDFLIRATTILTWGLGVSAATLAAYMALFDRTALRKSLASWRPSLAAGFLGAAASQFWFIGFALTSAANVRTLALIEVPLAQIASRRLYAEGVSSREGIGLGMIVLGVGALLLLSF